MTFMKLFGVDFNIAQIVVLYGTSIWLFLWHLKMCGVALNILYESTQKGVDRISYSCNFLCNMWNMLHKPDEHSHVESTYEAMCRGVDNEISIIPEIGLQWIIYIYVYICIYISYIYIYDIYIHIYTYIYILSTVYQLANHKRGFAPRDHPIYPIFHLPKAILDS